MRAKVTFKMYLAYVGLTVAQMAEILDCSAGYLQLVISGQKKPSPKFNRAIYQATDGWINLLEEELSAVVVPSSKRAA